MYFSILLAQLWIISAFLTVKFPFIISFSICLLVKNHDLIISKSWNLDKLAFDRHFFKVNTVPLPLNAGPVFIPHHWFSFNKRQK